MTEEEIDLLKEFVENGYPILFTFDFVEWELISQITPHPDEPGLVAWLKNRLIQCVVLYNCEARQFCIRQEIPWK